MYRLFLQIAVVSLSSAPLSAMDAKHAEAIKLGYLYQSDLYVPGSLQNYALAPHVEESYRSQNPSRFEKYTQCIDFQELAPIAVKYIDDKIGYGVFAQDTIEKNEPIGEYTGIVHHEDNRKWFHCDDYAWQINNGPLMVDGNQFGNELRFVNHSSDNDNVKVEFVPYRSWYHILYVAGTTIKTGEQLLVDYGTSYWSDRSDLCDLGNSKNK